jgi:hypothetical protein
MMTSLTTRSLFAFLTLFAVTASAQTPVSGRRVR